MKLWCFVEFSILCIFTVEIQSNSIKNYIEGYYWRDYVGYVPKDAVPGGKTVKGETTFIGNALHTGGYIVTGMIKRGDNKVYYEFAGVAYSATEDVKILCTQHPEQLVWMKLNIGHTTDNLDGNHLITVGHDGHGALTIGRKDIGNQVIIGNVVILGNKFNNFFAMNDDKRLVEGSYEVLVYNSAATTEIASVCNQKIININFYY